MPRVLNYKRDGLPCSKWANPFKLRRGAGRKALDEVIAWYERHLHDSGLVEPRHGDVLLLTVTSRPTNFVVSDRMQQRDNSLVRTLSGSRPL
jgi:hypothetical protein